MTLFIRAVATEDKGAAIKRAISGDSPDKFTPELDQFKELPGTPFAYWIGEGVRRAFNSFPVVEGDGRAVRVGMGTADDFRFIRAHWEVVPETRKTKWVPYAKGGELSPFYASLHLVVNWDQEGEELKAWVVSNPRDPRTMHWSRRIASAEFYLRPGMTWPLRASRFAPQPLPSGCIFSVRGYSVFLPEPLLLPALSIFNSRPFDYLFKALLGRFGYPEFIVGALQKLPWAQPSADQGKCLATLGRSAWSAARTADTAVETSLAFTIPAPLNSAGSIANLPTALAGLQQQIDTIAFDLFGLNEADRSEIEGAAVFASAEINELDEDNEDEELAVAAVENADFSLLSWSVGVAFGRFDIRLATGERSIPPEPEPFDALPDRSPGMLPIGTAPFMPCSGIFVDDPGHTDDLTSRIIAVYERVGQPCPEPAALRHSLAREFFADHIKAYTKSRRKAPIYWQLATPTASYSIWLFLHNLNKDTLFRAQTDFVGPKLAHEQRQLDQLRADAGSNPNASQRKAVEAQEAFVGELQNLLSEVKRVAPLWNPTLDDGVVLTMAPLWRLVPQNKAWQRELKGKWDELAAGKYDWAHIAMHLWPERVVPKCAEDRSLAIAHGLDAVFWVQGDDEKWIPRSTPVHSNDDIVLDQTSAAVKAALKDLSESSAPNSSKTRTRRSSS